MTLIAIVLVVWVLGAAYFLFFVGLPILLTADCDHAFILLAPACLVLPLIWPLAILFLLFLRVTGKDSS